MGISRRGRGVFGGISSALRKNGGGSEGGREEDGGREGGREGKKEEGEREGGGREVVLPLSLFLALSLPFSLSDVLVHLFACFFLPFCFCFASLSCLSMLVSLALFVGRFLARALF